MSESSTTPRRFRFATWRLVLAMACFAGAVAILTICLDVQGSNNTITWTKNQARGLMLFLFGPAIGALVGLGVGFLIRRPIISTIIGLLVPTVIDAAIVGYSWITVHW